MFVWENIEVAQRSEMMAATAAKHYHGVFRETAAIISY